MFIFFARRNCRVLVRVCEIDIGHCRTKVKVTAQLEIFLGTSYEAYIKNVLCSSDTNIQNL